MLAQLEEQIADLNGMKIMEEENNNLEENSTQNEVLEEQKEETKPTDTNSSASNAHAEASSIENVYSKFY